MAEIRLNSGSLSQNRKKLTEKHPDHVGKINVDRNLLMDLLAKHADSPVIKLSLSAWNKTNGETGDGFLSLSVSEPYEKPAANPWEQ
jgi:hypothetical protein